MAKKKTVIIIIAVIATLCSCCGFSYLGYKLITRGRSTPPPIGNSSEYPDDYYDDSSSDSTSNDSTTVIKYQDDLNSGSLWIGSMAQRIGSPDQTMHATYTFDFSYELNDPNRTITAVNISNISAQTSLPNGDLKIIPFAHVSRSENGGSIISTAQHEDWNTYGYVYASDYSKMKSIGTTYTPNICEEDKYCDYLDEVGKKGGEISLRFKYVNVGSVASTRSEYQAVHVIKNHGITAAQLSGQFSWDLEITLDDGTTEGKSFDVSIDGTSLDLASSNTIFLDF